MVKNELDDKLCKEFPNLYADRCESMTDTSMCWGFECGDGWYDIIYNLSAKLESIIVEYKKNNPGQSWPKASQVKQKFGSLRFYMTKYTNEIDDAILEAEKASEVACEICGKEGVMIDSAWANVKCIEHASKEGLFKTVSSLEKTVKFLYKKSCEQNEQIKKLEEKNKELES